MALPILGAAKVASILGTAGLKAARLAFKMYKKRNKNPVSEKKFLSDKAYAVKKAEMTKQEVKKAGNQAIDNLKSTGSLTKKYQGAVKQSRIEKKKTKKYDTLLKNFK